MYMYVSGSIYFLRIYERNCYLCNENEWNTPLPFVYIFMDVSLKFGIVNLEWSFV